MNPQQEFRGNCSLATLATSTPSYSCPFLFALLLDLIYRNIHRVISKDVALGLEEKEAFGAARRSIGIVQTAVDD